LAVSAVPSIQPLVVLSLASLGTGNRQGADIGTQHRSAIFHHDNSRKMTVEEVMAQFNGAKIWKKPIVTEAVPFKVFYKAEDYHQRYFERNPNAPYCQVVIEPKISKLRQHYWEKLKKV
jgi:peptide-methionine (S)-S-oxide reductase